ncbi:MAG: flavin reductase, partial [Ideonella sp.]
QDKFGSASIRQGLGGIPLIDGCAAYLECRRVASHEAGDHMIFVGEVERMELTDLRPLAFGGGRYLIAHAHDFGVASTARDASNRSRLQAVRLATHAAVELSARLDETIGLSVWGNHGPTVVHWELSRQPVSVSLRVGAVLPVLRSATGLVFTAWLPRDETAEYVEAEWAAAAALELGDELLPAGLEARLAGIRREGQCIASFRASFIDRSDVAVNALSVPVFHGDGRILLALTALGSSDRLDIGAEAQVPRALRECAARLSRRIGSG